MSAAEPELVPPDDVEVIEGDDDRAGRPGQRPGRPGHCVVCDAPVPGQRWYCDEHRGEPRSHHRKPGSAPRARTRSSGGAGAGATRTAERITDDRPRREQEKRSRVAQVGRVSDSAAAGTLSKLLIILAVILIHYRLRGVGFVDPEGEVAEALAPSNDEARDMVAPLARWGNASPLGARVIAPVVRNEDLVLSAYAWWEYTRRVNRWFDQQGRGGLAPVQPIRPRGEGEPSAQRAADQVIRPEKEMSPEQVRYQPDAPPMPGQQMPW